MALMLMPHRSATVSTARFNHYAISVAEPTPFLSFQSANALISDLRPTTVSDPALRCLNSLLDELLISLISATQSLNPYDLRKDGINSVFSTGTDKGVAQGDRTGVRTLGRSAVAEAELELRSWQDGREGSKGFPPDGNGSGVRGARAFPMEQAVALMRLKCVSFCTLAEQDGGDEQDEDEVLLAWKSAGGDGSDETVEPAALWLTAVIEHVCEHILTQLARVLSRDSESTQAGPQELYTALCEDESIWGFFKNMQAKDTLETAIRANNKFKRSTPTRAGLISGRSSPAPPGSPQSSRTVQMESHNRASGTSSPTWGMNAAPVSSEPRSSTETSRFGALAGGVLRKGSQLSRKNGGSPRLASSLRHDGIGHRRSGSSLSDHARSTIGGYDQSDREGDDQSPQDAQDEFDALVRSGETMKVSLTPSRLRNFDAGASARKKATPSSLSARSTPRLDHFSPQPSPQMSKERDVFDSPSRKLQARPATTIEEASDEDGSSRKESLTELLVSEGLYEPGSPTPKSQASLHKDVERTVPAVVLGTPPPKSNGTVDHHTESSRSHRSGYATTTDVDRSEPSTPPQLDETTPRIGSTSEHASPSVNRDRGYRRDADRSVGLNETSADEEAHRQSRNKKSEAQELADFFNHTPPPPASGPTFSAADNDSLPTSKSTRGFRALVSRVTGSGTKKKDEEREQSRVMGGSASHGRSNSISDGPKISGFAGFEDGTPPQATGLSSALPKKQKSLHNLSTVPAAFRPFADESSSQHWKASRVSLLERNSMSNDLTPIHSNTSSPTVSQHSQMPWGKKALESRTSSSSSGVKRAEGVGLGIAAIGDSSLPGSGSREKLPDLAPPVSVGNGGNKRLADPGASQVSLTPASARSFVTAPEGEERADGADLGPEGTATPTAVTAPLMHPASRPEVPESVQEGVQGAHPQSVTSVTMVDRLTRTTPAAANGLAKTGSLTIALSELVPLHHLLDHATSVDECRSLLSARLSEYGVPLADERASGGGQEGGVKLSDHMAAQHNERRNGADSQRSPPASSGQKDSLTSVDPLAVHGTTPEPDLTSESEVTDTEDETDADGEQFESVGVRYTERAEMGSPRIVNGKRL
ncbi:hypothetical protein IAU60_002277 [Kwoniella sp. DSM 27419]